MISQSPRPETYSLESSKFLVLRSWLKEIKSINLSRYLVWIKRYFGLPKKPIKTKDYKKYFDCPVTHEMLQQKTRNFETNAGMVAGHWDCPKSRSQQSEVRLSITLLLTPDPCLLTPVIGDCPSYGYAFFFCYLGCGQGQH